MLGELIQTGSWQAPPSTRPPPHAAFLSSCRTELLWELPGLRQEVPADCGQEVPAGWWIQALP